MLLSIVHQESVGMGGLILATRARLLKTYPCEITPSTPQLPTPTCCLVLNLDVTYLNYQQHYRHRSQDYFESQQ
jgi:hypothetical protein